MSSQAKPMAQSWEIELAEADTVVVMVNGEEKLKFPVQLERGKLSLYLNKVRNPHGWQ